MAKIPRASYVDVEPGQPIPTNPAKSCGTCTHCCWIVPVAEIGLTQYQRCPHLSAPWHHNPRGGCTIYENRPRSCRDWSCGWLISDLPDEYRPDRCHVVMDPMPDIVRVEGTEIVAQQIWVEPGHEEDWRIPEINQLILAALADGERAVVWRLKGGRARIFLYRDRQFFVSDTQDCAPQLEGDLTDAERLGRAQTIMAKSTR